MNYYKIKLSLEYENKGLLNVCNSKKISEFPKMYIENTVWINGTP